MKPTVLLFALIMLALGSCTEEVIKIIKETDTDTVWLQAPPQFVLTSKTEECVSTDTTKVEIIMPDVTANGQQAKDTTLAVTTACHMKITIKGKIAMEPIIITEDSIVYRDTTIFRDRNVPYPVPGPKVYKDTTIYETRVVYETVEYRYLFPGQSAFYIPEPFMQHYTSFHQEAQARNKQLPGGDVVLALVDPSELAGENWVSDGFEMHGSQWVIRISNELTFEESKSAIFRELAHWQLKKKYSNDISRVICPLFRTSPDPTVAEINTLFQ